MSSYKGVVLLTAEFTERFPTWQILVKDYLREKHTETLDLIESTASRRSADEAAIVDIDQREAFRERRARLAAQGVAHVLKFCAPELQNNLMAYAHSVIELWAELSRRFSCWAAAQAPRWEQELRQAAPKPGEPAATYMRRVRDIGRRLANAKRPQPTPTLIDDAIKGLERQRPSWQGICRECAALWPCNTRRRPTPSRTSSCASKRWRGGTRT